MRHHAIINTVVAQLCTASSQAYCWLQHLQLVCTLAARSSSHTLKHHLHTCSHTAAYRAFAALYARHWCGLAALTPDRAPAVAMPVLCRTFYELLGEVDPAVVRHLESIGVPPLELAFPWCVCVWGVPHVLRAARGPLFPTHLRSAAS